MWREPAPSRARVVILGIETSCDETAAAVVDDDGSVLSSVVSSQADLHARFGGVVPEIASRRHLELVSPVVRAALADARVTLEDVDRVAVTQGPGLVGALLVGISAAKALAWARGLPLVPVDHLEGHVASLYLEPEPLEPPFACLLASGGHTLLLAVSGARAVGASRHHARRRSRRGVRQGGAPARSRLSRRCRDRPDRPRGRPDCVRLSRCPRSRSRLLLLGPEDRSALRRSRPRRGGGRGAESRPRRVVPAGDRAGARATGA